MNPSPTIRNVATTTMRFAWHRPFKSNNSVRFVGPLLVMWRVWRWWGAQHIDTDRPYLKIWHILKSNRFDLIQLNLLSSHDTDRAHWNQILRIPLPFKLLPQVIPLTFCDATLAWTLLSSDTEEGYTKDARLWKTQHFSSELIPSTWHSGWLGTSCSSGLGSHHFPSNLLTLLQLLSSISSLRAAIWALPSIFGVSSLCSNSSSFKLLLVA